MEFYNVIKTRRSIRSYQKKDIPHEVLLRILNAARIAPSGNNRQPWSFVVVRDVTKKRAIAQACYGQTFIADAPVVIVCCAQRYPNPHSPWEDDVYLADAVIAIDHMVLAARNEGVGSCWIGAIHPKPIQELLNIPDDVDLVMVVPMGYPASGKSFSERCYRKSLKEICFDEEYGRPVA